jgi:hypothetical protein
MGLVFRLVFLLLVWISRLTGLTYKEVNVIGWYLVIPLGFLLLIDRILKLPFLLSGIFVLAWVVLLFVVPNFSRFSDSVFDASVVFLKRFIVLGWDYTAASVIVCVVVPVIVFAVLGYFAFRPRVRDSVGSVIPN